MCSNSYQWNLGWFISLVKEKLNAVDEITQSKLQSAIRHANRNLNLSLIMHSEKCTVSIGKFGSNTSD